MNENYCIHLFLDSEDVQFINYERNSCAGEGCIKYKCKNYNRLDRNYNRLKSYKVNIEDCYNCEFRCPACNGTGSLDWVDLIVKKD